jgi:protein-L-isoaspartate(D-aspartate) O-methyltransferase
MGFAVCASTMSERQARASRFPLALDKMGGRPAVGTKVPVRVDASATVGDTGLVSPALRQRMVDRIRAEGIDCPLVLEAMTRVPRHLFVDSGLAAQAYEDTSLPIGHGQTISKPSVVARMLALLFEGRSADTPLGRVLEIGTGCGYQAAVLACLSRQVVSVERLQPLHDRARETLAPMRAGNLRLVYGDGRLGHPPNAPYDAIVSAAGGEDIPPAWLEQLAVGGRLVAPVHAGAGGPQVLVTVDRDAAGWSRRVHEAVRFVPLRSGTA